MTNPQPLVFYTDPGQQLRFKPYCSDVDFRIYASLKDLGGGVQQVGLPFFQIPVPATVASAFQFAIVNLDGGVVGTLSPSAISRSTFTSGAGVLIFDTPATTVVSYPSPSIPQLAYDEPYYLFVVDDDGTSWYSEVFYFAEASATPGLPISGHCGEVYCLLEWSSPCNLPDWYHSDGSFRVFIPGDVARPEYHLKKEVVEDGDGLETVLFRSSRKRLRFITDCPGYMADALHAIQFFKTLTVTNSQGLVYTADDNVEEVTVEWSDDCIATVTVTFWGDFIKKTACC